MPLGPFLFLMLASAPAVHQSATVAPVRVSVVTDAWGDPDDLADRRQSVEDLVKALSSKSKKKVLTVVSDVDPDADDAGSVVINVTDRGVQTPKFVMGLTRRPGQPGSPIGPVRTPLLRVEVTIGDDDPVVLTNNNKPPLSSSGWKSAAENLADQIEKLLGERGPA